MTFSVNDAISILRFSISFSFLFELSHNMKMYCKSRKPFFIFRECLGAYKLKKKGSFGKYGTEIA